MKIYNNATELVGHTPLLRLMRYEKAADCKASILAKLECFNPAGSAKDRVALQMILDAAADGSLQEGGVIIEPTSGNTGIGLASIAVPMGYRVILTMPANMSAERRMLLAAYGAEVVLTDAERGMTGAIEKASELAKEIPNAYLPSQFSSPSNARAHESTTGPEIWSDTDGALDVFISAVGTGGTLTGSARYLKKKNPKIRIVAVEPASSPVLSGGKAGAHGIQGIGAGFIPKVMDLNLVDEVLTVTEEEAYEAARDFAKTEGILVGISSGAALAAATRLAKKSQYQGKRIVVVLPDTGERYLTTPLFSK